MRRVAAAVLCVLILVSCAAVYASGGTAADPLVSLGYLNGTYIPGAVEQAAGRVDAGTQSTYQSVLDGLNARHGTNLARAGGESDASAAYRDQRLKKGDVLTLSTGSGVLLLAGSASVGYTAGGAAVDVTAGQALPSGSALPVRHRVLAGENTAAAVTITSDTAVVSVEGYYTLSPSANMDYDALAGALNAMGIFQGTGTAYGSGYDLETAPTRVVGLVMFLRMVGEEGAALAYTGDNPFSDTPAWCDRYVAYAYAKGYTNGVGTGDGGRRYFAPDTAISAGEYMTFVLRALGYTDAGQAPDFHWSTALGRSLELGVLTQGEYRMLTTGAFLRAQVAYLSYFALSVPVKDGGGTLLDRMIAAAGVDEAALYTALNSVSVQRLP